MQATRAYWAGFGTAGSMLAGAAALFVLGSAIVALQGWPKVAGQSSPSAVQLNGGPVYGSPVSRRLRAVTTAAPALRVPLARRARRAGRRPPAGTSSPVARRTGDQPSSRPRAGIPTATPVDHGAHTSLRADQGGSGDITVTTPTDPPVKITIPLRRVTSVPGAVLNQVEAGATNATGPIKTLPVPGAVAGG